MIKEGLTIGVIFGLFDDWRASRTVATVCSLGRVGRTGGGAPIRILLRRECPLCGGFDLFDIGCSTIELGFGLNSTRVGCSSTAMDVTSSFFSVPSSRFLINISSSIEPLDSDFVFNSSRVSGGCSINGVTSDFLSTRGLSCPI